ncbi:3-methyl-2-oxobutanoate hydroxymethyltransferase [Haloplanus halophilus]|uniref:3-methyl-2-oxobutanoate hydroxymethyltransferase n=1 Tax=Haloplanus halophilus TaxID=2949993 RepID=UPI0020400145|nr:3-methyl-2-oxobutanoate hydroxymethyltransferase [Haloplanus sp. GDY1]
MPTVQEIRQASADGEPLTMLTAYDAPTAGIVDAAGIDVILVGDSMGNAVLGYDSTLPVTMEEVASHTGAVARATEDALVVADMPFLSYGTTDGEGVENAGRLIKEAGANAVKIESGPHTVGLTERLVDLGIPVMAHLGLTPQRLNEVGGYTRQGTTEDEAREIRELARRHEEAGAFSLVIEHVPDDLAAEVTADLDVPVIGIGAGPETDGQVLVLTDVIGLSESTPPFAEEFGDVRGEIADAVAAYRDAVEGGEFP